MTCHSPMPNGFSSRVRMSPEQFEEYVALVTEAADAAPEGFEVLLGLESDFFPGMEDWLRELHGRASSTTSSVRSTGTSANTWTGSGGGIRSPSRSSISNTSRSPRRRASSTGLAHPDLVKKRESGRLGLSTHPSLDREGARSNRGHGCGDGDQHFGSQQVLSGNESGTGNARADGRAEDPRGDRFGFAHADTGGGQFCRRLEAMRAAVTNR